MMTPKTLAIVLAASALALTPSAYAAEPLRLVPTPRQVTPGDGRFTLSADTPIVLQSTDPADRLAADQLVDEAKTDLGVTLSIKDASDNKPSILLERRSIELPPEAIAEGYSLNVTANQVTLQASTSAGFYYGVQTLKQLLRANAAADHSIPAVAITDWPIMRYRGWQDDISRGPIPTVAFLKREILTMSEMKCNFFTLYTEHVFKLKKHPDIAPADGITADEARELTAFAAAHHVELAGNFQSFGHFANILKLPKYAPLGANSWALDPANENAYKFLNDAYSEIAPAYASPLFCISCDEVGNLGAPDAQALIKRLGEGGVYAYHINRVTALLKQYGKTPMMWGDIALEHPEDIGKLSRDVIILPWTYGDSGTYDRWLKPYADAGLNTIVCPGANNWNRLWPDVDVAANNISDFTRDGVQYHSIGMLNTTWRDSGESLVAPTFYPLLWGAECAWSPVLDAADRTDHKARTAKRDQFDRAFDGVFYGLAGADVALANRALGSGLLKNPVAGAIMDHTFWTDPHDAWAAVKDPTPAATELVGAMAKITDAVHRAKSAAKHNAYTLDVMAMEARRVAYLGQRVLVADRVMHGQGDWSDLTAQLDAIKAQFVQLWKVENRDWWLDQDVAKFDKLQKEIAILPQRVAFLPPESHDAIHTPVTLQALTKGEVHYTLDGSEPTKDSPLFKEPINLTHTTTIKARNFMADQTGPVCSATYTALRLPASVRATMPAYEDNEAVRAFDADDASFFWSARNPVPGDRVTVLLTTPATFKTISARTGHPTFHRDSLEQGVLEISTDGKKWTTLAEFKDGNASASAPAGPIKGIRIRVTGPQKGWLAVQDITVE